MLPAIHCTVRPTCFLAASNQVLTQSLEEDNQATSGGSVAANAHKANPVRSTPSLMDRVQYKGWRLTGKQGPVHADNLPEPASKEELKKRAKELNK